MRISTAFIAGVTLLVVTTVTGRAVETVTNVTDTAAGLRKEARELRPTRFHFGPPFDLPPERAIRAQVLRERLEIFTRTHSGEDLNLDWFIAAEETFLSCAVSEWNEWAKAEAGLRSWWELLAQAQPSEPHFAANLSLRLASYVLQGWAHVEPERALAILHETDGRFASAASTAEQPQWKWWVARFSETLVRSAKQVPDSRRPAFLEATEALLVDYAHDETLPLDQRTFSVTRRARMLYSAGLSREAATLLDTWGRQFGDQIRTPDYYATRFYVAYVGLGDLGTARAMIERATQLVQAGAFAPQDGNFRGMTDAYYAKLPLTETELKRRAFRFRQERHSQGLPVPLTTPLP